MQCHVTYMIRYFNDGILCRCVLKEVGYLAGHLVCRSRLMSGTEFRYFLQHSTVDDPHKERHAVGTIFLIIGWYQEHFVCAVLGTMCSRFCVTVTKCSNIIPDIIWNIIPNNIRHTLLIPDFGS
jgi:hypothetical protein